MSFRTRTRRCRTWLSTALAVFVLSSAAQARAAEVTAFFSGGKPGEVWGRGIGGAFTISFFDLVHGELEGASQGSDLADTRLLTGAAKAYVGPTIGRFVPYAGLGTGLYRESLPGDSESGRYTASFVGVKLRFPVAFVLRGELQWVHLPVEAPIDMDKRYFVGAGLRF